MLNLVLRKVVDCCSYYGIVCWSVFNFGAEESLWPYHGKDILLYD